MRHLNSLSNNSLPFFVVSISRWLKILSIRWNFLLSQASASVDIFHLDFRSLFRSLLTLDANIFLYWLRQGRKAEAWRIRKKYYKNQNFISSSHFCLHNQILFYFVLYEAIKKKLWTRWKYRKKKSWEFVINFNFTFPFFRCYSNKQLLNLLKEAFFGKSLLFLYLWFLYQASRKKNSRFFSLLFFRGRESLLICWFNYINAVFLSHAVNNC